MKKLLTTHTVRLLLAFLCLVGSFTLAKADVTIWVYGTSSPWVKSWSGFNGSQQLTESVTKDGNTWYYYTFTGVSSMSFAFNTADAWDGDQGPNLTATSGDNYYYYDSSNKLALDVAKYKNASQCYFIEAQGWYKVDYMWTKLSSNDSYVLMEKLSKDGVYHGWTGTSTPSSIYFERGDENSAQWNPTTTGASYTKGNTYIVNEASLSGSNSTLYSKVNVTLPTSADIQSTLDPTNLTFGIIGAGVNSTNNPSTSSSSGVIYFTNNGDGTYTLDVTGAKTGQWCKLSRAEGTHTFSSWDDFNGANGGVGKLFGNSNYGLGENTLNSGGGNFTFSSGGNITLTISNITTNTIKLTISQGATSHTYTVGGTPTSVFGGSSTYDATLTANDMTASGTTYSWTKSDFLYPSSTIQYKVFEDHSTSTSYPSSANTVTGGTAGKVSTLTVTFNPDNNSVSHTLTEATFTVAGNYNDSGAFGAQWSATNTANDMTFDSSTGKYTWTSGQFTHNGTAPSFKVCKDHAWTTSYPTNNQEIGGGQNGYTYTITVTYDPSDNSVTGTLNLVSAPAKTWYVLNNFGGNWNLNNSGALMTANSTNTVYTWTYNFSSLTSDIQDFLLADALDSSNNWDSTWKSNNAYAGSNSADTDISPVPAGASAPVVQSTNAKTYKLPARLLGTYTFTYDVLAGTITVAGAAPATPIYFHKWSSGSQFSAGTATAMSSTDAVNYTITLDLDKGDYVLFTNSSSNDWNANTRYAPASGNLTLTGNDSGTAATDNSNVFQTNATTGAGNWTFTFNNSTLAWTATQNSVTTDPLYLRHWTDNIANGSAVAMTTSDNVNYTVSNVTLARDEYVVFSTVNTGAWGSGTQWNCTESADKTFASGTQETAGTSGSKAYKAPVAGTWSFTFNTSTGAWTPTLTASSEAWYFVGEVTDWATNKEAMTDNGDGTFSITKTFSGKFKIYDGTNWWGADDNSDITMTATNNQLTLANGRANLNLANSGTYTLTWNPSTHVLTVTGFPLVYYLNGSFSTWTLGDAAALMTDNGNGTVTFTKNFTTSTTGDEYFIITDETSGWDAVNNGHRFALNNAKITTPSPAGTTSQLASQNDGVSAYLPAGMYGSYTFTFNPTTNVLTVAGAAPFETWYIKGDLTNWTVDGSSSTGIMSTTDGVIYTWKTTYNNLSKNAINFCLIDGFGTGSNSGWDDVNANHRYAKTSGQNADITLGTAEPVTKLGDNSNYSLPAGLFGEYTFTFNKTNMTLTVTGAAPTSLIDLYMFGKQWSATGYDLQENSRPDYALKLTSNDGVVYTASNVEFKSGAEFGISTLKADNNDDGGWTYMLGGWYAADNRNDGGTDGEGSYTFSTTDIGNAVALGTVATNKTRWFKIGDGLLSSGDNYNVQVTVSNGVPVSVKLQKSTVTNRAHVNVYIEKNSIVTEQPGVVAFDIRGGRTHSTTTGYNEPYTVEYIGMHTTVVDGIEWYVFQVNNGIADLLIYKGNDASNTANWLNDPTDPALTNMLIRRSGDVYINWVENSGNKYVEDYTRVYYEDAVSEAPTEAAVIDGHYYVYFVDTPHWGANHNGNPPHIYAWDFDNTEILGSWDGVAMTHLPNQYDGYDVYVYDFGPISSFSYNGIKGVIFNCGEGQEIEEQTGDFEFHNGAVYDYCGVVSLGRELGTIIRGGVVNGPQYTIENSLIIVYYDETEQAFYAKDENRANSKSINDPNNPKRDYVFDVTHTDGEDGVHYELLMPGKVRYDQSNWVKLTKAETYNEASTMEDGEVGYDPWANPSAAINQLIGGELIHGQLLNNVNPAMKVVKWVDGKTTYTYSKNEYIMPHFNDNYTVSGSSTNSSDFFFVRPKANEVATITWAVYTGEYNGSYQFYVPKTGFPLEYGYTGPLSGMFVHGNNYGLQGAINVKSWNLATVKNDGTVVSNPDMASLLDPGQAYTFDAIIRYKETPTGGSSGAPAVNRLKYVDVEVNDGFDPDDSQFEIYPIAIDVKSGIVTAIKDVKNDAAKTIQSVKVYDTMGVERREMQGGVNIVVTTYSDGTRSVQKILK